MTMIELISLAVLALAVVYFVRWWQMTNDIRAIREAISPRVGSNNFSRLLLLGRRDQAKEVVVKELLSRLMFFQLGKSPNKEEQMRQQIASCSQFLSRYGMELPPELSTLERFQELMQCNNGRPAPAK